MLERLNEQLLLEARNVDCGFVKDQSRHIETTLEESAFFDPEQKLTEI